MNQLTCLHCGVTIESKSVHDFKWCNCKRECLRVAVDGGSDYQRRCYGIYAWWEEADGERLGLCALCGRGEVISHSKNCVAPFLNAAAVVARTPKHKSFSELVAQWEKDDALKGSRRDG